jgi:hypothetical protein
MEAVHSSKTYVLATATHSVTSQKAAFFIVTTMKMSNLAVWVTVLSVLPKIYARHVSNKRQDHYHVSQLPHCFLAANPFLSWYNQYSIKWLWIGWPRFNSCPITGFFFLWCPHLLWSTMDGHFLGIKMLEWPVGGSFQAGMLENFW